MRHLVYDTFKDRTNMRFLTEGRVQNSQRPIWSVRRINHRIQDLGRAGYADIDQWSLAYWSTDRQDADFTLEAIKQAIVSGGIGSRRSNRIPGWRFNWQYPQPVISQVVGTGSLAQNQAYQVRVSGIDLCDNESAASIPLLVTLVAPNNTLSIRILREPYLAPLFKSYNVYINGHLQINILHPTVQLYPVATIETVVDSGAIPREPSNDNPTRWKYIRVDSYNDSVREDDITNGLFNATITLQTSTYQEKNFDQPEAVWEITGTQIVNDTPVVIAPVGPYVVQRTNKVKIGY
jgi:hypothetical protein